MDQVWAEVGAFGLYQWLMMSALPLAVLAIGGNFLLSSYLILEPEWTCDLGPNKTFGQNCTVYSECGSLTYRSEFYSIGEQYGLLCDKAYISHFIVSLGTIPTCIGLLVWGPLADRVGRKLPVLLSMTLLMGGSAGCALASTWPVFTVFRMLFGFGFGGGNIVVIWAMEYSDQPHGFLINAFTHWHYAYMLVAFLGWQTQNWQLYLTVLNSICAPVLLVFAFYMKESPRWFIQKGRYKEALEVLQYVGRWNSHCRRGPPGKELRESDLRDADPLDHSHPKTPTRLNFCSLFKDKTTGVRSATLGLTFFAASVASGVVILDVGHLSGGVSQNLFLLGLFRCFTPLASVGLDWRFPNLGRRQFLFASQSVVLACFLVVCAANTLLPAMMEDDTLQRLKTFFSLGGAILNMFVWIVLIQFTFEMYPTLLRNTAISFTGSRLLDNIGSIVIPQIVYFGRVWLAGPAVVASLLLISAMTAGAAVFPETKATDSKPLVLKTSKPGRRVKLENLGFDASTSMALWLKIKFAFCRERG